MEIISWNFFYLSIITIFVYYILSRRAQNIWLLIVSYFFYSNWNWYFPVVLLATSLFNFFIAQKIARSEESQKKLYLWIGISINTIALLSYRIIDNSEVQFIPSLVSLIRINTLKDIVLPIGFSFYCLQGISYLVDVYRMRTSTEDDFVDFALYMSYFPKLVAGPIERASSFLPQLKKQRIVDNEKIESGFSLILIGVFRKVVIAGLLLANIPNNYLVSSVENTKPYLGLLSFPFYYYKDPLPYYIRLFGIICYVIYLYNDFAGYSNIVRGISTLFGINISENFKQPFFASTFIDFWNRWHISLSNWLRDYIYYPLTRRLLRRNNNNPNIINICIPPIITMLVSGLWHGLFPAMILWGFLYGIILSSEHIIFRKWPSLNPQKQQSYTKLFRIIVVFTITNFLFVLFASKSLPITFAFWKVIIKGTRQPISGDFPFVFFALPIASFVLDFLQSKFEENVFFKTWPTLGKAGVIVMVLMSIAIAAMWTTGSVSEQFVYQGF